MITIQSPADLAASRFSRSRTPRLITGLTLLIALLLRLIYAAHYRYDSDEPQHLHVVWCWLHGLLPYRDFFDNHMPLFHLLCTPALWVLGERADVLFYMRLAMIPVYLITIAASAWIAHRCFGRLAALFTAAILAVYPWFFLHSLEYRTDDLWAMFWMLTLAVCAYGRLNWRTALLAGFMLGCTLSVSLKTSLLLGCFAISLLTTGLLAWRDRSLRPRWIAPMTTGFLAFLAIPLAIVIFFLAKGAGHQMFYATIQHNVGAQAKEFQQVRIFVPVVLLVMAWQIRGALRGNPSAAAAAPELIFAISNGLYLALLLAFWPILDSQDYLPAYPWIAISVAMIPTLIAHKHPRVANAVGTLIIAAEISAMLISTPLLKDRVSSFNAYIADVLKLTREDDLICDIKGETIYRKRPTYLIYEKIAKQKLRQHLMQDDIPQHLIDTRTCVLGTLFVQFDPSLQQFLHENYIRTGRLFSAGKAVVSEQLDRPLEKLVDIKISTTYVLVSPTGAVQATLDGSPWNGSRFLSQGVHELRLPPRTPPAAIVWSKAIERGFTPNWAGILKHGPEPATQPEQPTAAAVAAPGR